MSVVCNDLDTNIFQPTHSHPPLHHRKYSAIYTVPIPRSRAAHPSIGLIIVRTPIGNERSKSGYNINHLPQRSFLPINHIVVEPICQSYCRSIPFLAFICRARSVHFVSMLILVRIEKTSSRSTVHYILTTKQRPLNRSFTSIFL